MVPVATPRLAQGNGAVPPRVRFPRMATPRPVVLFTALEPSGDAHAAPVVARLRAAHPHLRVVAWGGPRMEAAGAEMMGRTADDGVMGLAGLSKVREVRRQHDEIVAWARKDGVAVHMPVDSPSANYPLSARLKPLGARIVNLVAPQLWAWAPWRIGKVRRISDVLLCLLPFEEAWFRSRGVVAKYVGHPVMAKPIDEAAVEVAAARLPRAASRVVLLPGSRSSEVRRNGALLAEAFAGIRRARPGTAGVVVASNARNADLFRNTLAGPLPDGLLVEVGGDGRTLEAALHWAELALAVSGTVSLDCVRQAKPVVGVYRTSRIEAAIAPFVLSMPDRLLPNIVAGRRIVPEFVPFAGGAAPVARAALELREAPDRLAAVVREMAAVRAAFGSHDPSRTAAEVVARSAAGERLSNDDLDGIVRRMA